MPYRSLLLRSLLLCLSFLPLQADVFSQGQKHVAISISSGSSYNTTYTIVGVKANYFIVDNLSMGLAYRGWFGGDPGKHELSIPLTYHAPLHPVYRPYAGAFYRHSFMTSPYQDYDVYGFRVGISLQLSPNSYSTFGWVQEYYPQAGGDGSARGYPEISVGLSF
ncbi:MAG: hypothetical protein DSZ03_08125 [Sulfurimonas sp.]|nr:MAG: hypothetical protein DSZ03_08125 [Sulfurimonas sp.]